MANRLLFGKFGTDDYRLRVSRPGFDVLSPALTGKQLAFDSKWLEAANLMMFGTFSFPTVGSPAQTIAYGETLPYLPVCMVYEIAGPATSGFSGAPADQPPYDTYCLQYNVGVTIYNDRLVIATGLQAIGFYVVLRTSLTP